MTEPGREVVVPWRDTTVRAWRPDPLGARSVRLRERTVRATERAAARLEVVSATVPAGFEPLARLLRRAEGVASSRVEGVEAPLIDVALAEVTTGARTAGHVADNLAVVEEALRHARGDDPLRTGDLLAWHRRLMSDGWLPAHLVGAVRSEVGWIGGPDPTRAVFVAAPPDDVGPLMDDLVAVTNACPWDPVTTAGLVHAQFETIHPFGDGNGRVGRVLALWVLVRHLDAVTVAPPLSVGIARDTDRYVAALGAFRIGMDDEIVSWFAATVGEAADVALDWARSLVALVDRWEAATADMRVDAAARRLLPVLAATPVVSVEMAADALDVSLTAARSALTTLTERGVLDDLGTVPAGAGRPRRWWAARGLLDLIQPAR